MISIVTGYHLESLLGIGNWWNWTAEFITHRIVPWVLVCMLLCLYIAADWSKSTVTNRRGRCWQSSRRPGQTSPPIVFFVVVVIGSLRSDKRRAKNRGNFFPKNWQIWT